MPVTSHQTRWTLIPRGIDPNSQTMQFTVVVSPTMYSTGADNIPGDTALEQTVWANWYRTLADLLKAVDAGSTPLFLSLQSDLSSQPLALKLQGNPGSTKRHPSSSSADDATWAALWSDLTRIFPDHLEPDSPAKQTAQLGRAHLVNASFAGETAQDTSVDSTVLTTSYSTPRGMFSHPRSFSLLAETISKTQILASRDPGRHTAGAALAQTSTKTRALQRFAGRNSNKSVSDVARVLTDQHLEDARLYARGDSDTEKVLRADLTKEIQTWVDSVKQPTNDDQKLQHRHARQAIRNLYRLSRTPFVELKLDAMLYVYEKQRAGLSGFTPSHEFDDLRKKLSDQRKSFIDIAVFHRRAKHKTKTQQARQTVPVGGACLQYGDFLKVLNTLGHYSQVLYGLGLAFDVVAIEKADWSKAKRMWVELEANVATTLQADTTQPSTAVSFVMGDASHAPYPADSSDSSSDYAVIGGYLSLDGCTVIDYDSDAISLGTTQYADNPPNQVLDGAGGALAPPAGATQPDTLPLKSAGLTILPPSLDKVVQSRLTTQTGNRDKSGDQLVFSSTDLVRGFAPQVIWRNQSFSLTARIDTYDYRKTDGSIEPLLSAEEVGAHPIQLEATYARDYAEDEQQTQPSTDLHIAPSLLRWNGWSLLVKSPFDVAKSANTKTMCAPAPKFPVKPSHLPPQKDNNKLPSLRFGETYTFQVRAIDIAGNSIASPKGTKPSAVAGQYLRHDPISAPVLLVEDSFDPVASPGEQLDVMVARLDDPNHQPLRYLCPQVCDLHSLIWQGALDHPNGNLRPPIDTQGGHGVGSFDDVKLESNGNFPTKVVPKGAANGTKGTYAVPVYEYPNGGVSSGAYLPDSYARKACFHLVDVATGAVYPLDPISFYARADSLPDDDPQRPDFEWPHAEHVQVQLKTFEDKEPTLRTTRKSWNVAQPDRINTRLEIDVPAGWQMELQVSCAPSEDQAKTMAPIALAQQENIDAFEKSLSASGMAMPQVGQNDVTKLLVQGMSNLYTPNRPLGLVATVKKPRRESYIQGKTAQVLPQAPDSALATFSATIHVEDGRATGMLDVYLVWWEYTDDPTKSAPSKLQMTQHLGQYPNVAVNQLFQWQPDDHGYIANDLPFPDPTQAAKTTFKFPDSRHRQVDIRIDSVSRFVSYYNSDPNASTTDFTLPGTTLANVSVKNTTRPDPLVVTHIKPLFPSIANRTAQHSFGGAMRIHFARGIYSAGECPKIGIVVADDDDKPSCGNDSWQTDPVKAGLYTRWGLDPTRDAAGLGENTNNQGFTPAPKEAHFTLSQKLVGFDDPVAKTVQLAELSSPPAKILTYNPVFTPEDGWYCDIILNQIPAYNCFLRLALVLYQEQSLEEKKVSTVSLAAFVQLRADRTMTLLPTKTKHQLALVIDGTRPGFDVDGKTTSFAVSVEIHDHGVWITDPDTTVCAVPAACPAPVLQGGDSAAAGPLLAEYVLTIAKHRGRKRRLRVEEFESRRTYDPVTLADVIGPPALVYAMEPMLLPHL